MKKIIFLVLLLLTACTSGLFSNDEERITGALIKPDVKTVELWFINETFFEPSTIVVEKDTRLVIQFMNTEPYQFLIMDLGLKEWAGAGYLELEFDKRGEFVYECFDCENSKSGLLRVI